MWGSVRFRGGKVGMGREWRYGGRYGGRGGLGRVNDKGYHAYKPPFTSDISTHPTGANSLYISVLNYL